MGLPAQLASCSVQGAAQGSLLQHCQLRGHILHRVLKHSADRLRQGSLRLEVS